MHGGEEALETTLIEMCAKEEPPLLLLENVENTVRWT